MKYLAGVVLTTAAAVASAEKSFSDLAIFKRKQLGQDSRIIGGIPAQEGRYPWFTAVGVECAGLNACATDDQFMLGFCGASLIAPDLLLTAAHCVFDFGGQLVPSIAQIGAFYATDNLQDGATSNDTVRVVEWFVHPDYDVDSVRNDIAILRLESPVFGVPSIKLLAESIDEVNRTSDVDTLTVIGLGVTIEDSGETPSQLMEVDVSYIEEEFCGFAYGSIFEPASMFCAVDPGQGSCFGDSGGPIFVTYGNDDIDVQVGVVSWGGRCALSESPGVYSDIGGLKAFVDSVVESQGAGDVFISIDELLDTPTSPPSPTPAPVPTPEPTTSPTREIPPGWFCPNAFYGAADGCDCECGAYDPDCDLPNQVLWNCGYEGIGCSADFECIYADNETATPSVVATPSPAAVPQEWFCLDAFYNAADGCDCECGAYDPDCDLPNQFLYNCGYEAIGCSADFECIYPGNETDAPTGFPSVAETQSPTAVPTVGATATPTREVTDAPVPQGGGEVPQLPETGTGLIIILGATIALLIGIVAALVIMLFRKQKSTESVEMKVTRNRVYTDFVEPQIIA